MNKIYNTAAIFEAEQEKARQKEHNSVKEIVKSISELSPDAATDLAAAIESATDYIKKTRQYSLFGDSSSFATLIWSFYRERKKGNFFYLPPSKI